MDIARKYTKQLDDIKKKVEAWHDNFMLNNKNFEDWRDFLFKSTMDRSDSSRLLQMNKPAIGMNTIEAIVTKMCSEFVKNMPMVEVRAANDNKNLIQQVDIVEGICREIYANRSYQDTSQEVMKETMSGGFSAMRIDVDYKSNKTFDQGIFINKVYSPTWCGFDPIARDVSKRDGNYCYQSYPKSREEVESEYKIDLTDEVFKTNYLDQNAFPWFYKNGKKDIVIVCEFFKKEFIEETLYLIENPFDGDHPKSITKENYELLRQEWRSRAGGAQFPKVIDDRPITRTAIKRYSLVGNQLLAKPDETIFCDLPIVFFDGDSFFSTRIGQFCRPVFFNAIQPTRVRNYIISTLVNQVENLRDTNVIMPEQALPNDLEAREAWNNPQMAKAALLYNQQDINGNPTNPPQPFSSGEVNPALLNLYSMQEEVIKSSMGAWNLEKMAQRGVGVVEALIDANTAAGKYILNYLTCQQQVTRIIVNILPKLYTTATTIPVIDKMGKNSYISIDPESGMIDYEQGDLDVVVQVGANFEAQKDKAAATISDLITKLPALAELINTTALPLFLENFDIRNIDKIIMQAEEMLEQKKQQAAMQAQNPPPDPNMVLAQAEMKKAENQAMSSEIKYQIEMMRMKSDEQIKKMEMAIESLKTMGDFMLRQQQADDSKAQKSAEMGIKFATNMIKSSTEESRTVAEEDATFPEEVEIKKSVTKKKKSK